MSADWRFLGEAVIIQSVRRLAKNHGLRIDLPDERMLYGASLLEFNAIMGNYKAVLRRLFKEFDVSWMDIYSNSDVGKERLALAKGMGIEKRDIVLDVGCGRGYFTAAAAMHSRFVVGLDSMDGFGRKGWWHKFGLTMQELTLRNRILEVKGNAALMPIRSGTFSAVVSVHSVRSFRDPLAFQHALKEMKRVTHKGGRVIIVESLPNAVNKAQEAHLRMYNCKVKHSGGDMYYFTEDELIDFLENADLRKSRARKFDLNLSAAPPFFFLNTQEMTESRRTEAEREYSDAVEAVRKWGESSPPALLVEAIVE